MIGSTSKIIASKGGYSKYVQTVEKSTSEQSWKKRLKKISDFLN